MIIPKGWKFTLNKRISVLLFLMIMGGFLSCKKDKERKHISSREESFNYYFPLQTDSLDEKIPVNEQGKLDPIINEWFSKYLQKMEEPNLSKKEDSGYIIRYTFLADMIFYPETYRIQKNFNEWYIYYKQVELIKFPYSSYEPGKLLKNTITPITWHQFYNLENKLNKFDISNQTTHGELGLDGEIHILEVYENGKYQFIYRWSPREEDEKEFIELYEMIESLHPVKEIK